MVVAMYAWPVLILLGPSLNSAHALVGGDWSDLIYPLFSLTQDTFAKEGRLPFWNPGIFSGMPHLASMNVLALYPTELAALFTAVTPGRFYAIDLIVHLLFAGWAMRRLLLELGRSEEAAAFGGLAYLLGGHMLTLAGAGHPHWVRCLAWLPLVWMALERGRVRSSPGWYAAAGGFLAPAMLTAALQFVVLAVTAGAGWVMLGSRGERVRTRVVRLGVFVAAAMAIGAVAWMPGVEYFLESVRSSPQEGRAGAWALTGWDLLTWGCPEIWGTLDPYFGPHPFRSTTDAPGLLVAALAAAGAVEVWRRDRRWVWLAFAALVLALGPGTPVGAALSALPVFSGFRTPLRWLSFLHLASCVLAARGWDRLATSGRPPRWLVILPVTMALIAAVGWINLDAITDRTAEMSFVRERLAGGLIGVDEIHRVQGGALLKMLAVASLSAAALWVVTVPRLFPGVRLAVGSVVLAGELSFNAAGYLLSGPAPAPADRVTDAVIGLEGGGIRRGVFRVHTDEYFGLPNRRLATGLEWTLGYHGLPLRRYHRAALTSGRNAGFPFFDLLGVRYLALRNSPPGGWPLARVTRGDGVEIGIHVNPSAFRRVFLAGELVRFATEDELFEALAGGFWTAARVPSDSLVRTERLPGPLARTGEIAWRFDRDEIGADIDLERPGLVVFSEVWYPAWKGFLDGTRAPVLRVFGFLRGFEVPAGRHRIRMVYDSWPFKAGLWCSLASASAGVAVVAAVRRRRPRSHHLESVEGT